MAKKITDTELDYLKELATIGFGHAATALSQLVNHKVNINVPKVTVATVEKLHQGLGEMAPIAVTVRLQVFGRLKGDIALFFPRESAMELVDIMEGEQVRVISSKEVQSMIEEVSSILSGAYLTAISEMTGITQTMSTPKLLIDMPGAIVDEILIGLSSEDEYAVLCETSLRAEGRKITAYFIFLNSLENLKVILKSLERHFK